MFRFFKIHRSSASASFWPPLRRDTAANWFLIFLLFGVVTGSIFATYSADSTLFQLPQLFCVAERQETFLSAFWNSGKYFLFLLFSASTYFGIILIPALSLLRGYTLGFSVAELFSVSSYSGLWRAFCLDGISAILTLPVFLLLSNDSFLHAKDLLSFRRSKLTGPDLRFGFTKHIVLSLILAVIDCVYRFCILPGLMIN